MQTFFDKYLSDELIELGNYLQTIPEAMRIEMLDGFLAALVCSPKQVRPSTYLPYIWGDNHEFTDMEDAVKYPGYISNHRNVINRHLSYGAAYPPVITTIKNDNSIGNDWALGFMQGVYIGGDAWEELFLDRQNRGIFIPILELVHGHESKPGIRPHPVSEKEREHILSRISSSLLGTYEYFSGHRRKRSVSSSSRSPSRNASRSRAQE